jgi:hypothetical protein
MPGMCSPPLSALPTLADGLPGLARAGWLDPAAHPADLAAAAARLWAQAPALAARWRSQRLAIEGLRQSRNPALAAHWLPALCAGERAATLPLPLQAEPLQALDTGRGWRLHGRLPGIANADPDGFTLLAPVWLDGGTHWVALRSEEDGLDRLPPAPGEQCSWSRAAQAGELRCRGVFFREDEALGVSALSELLEPLRALLSPAHRSP